jgi:hypothetical protein
MNVGPLHQEHDLPLAQLPASMREHRTRALIALAMLAFRERAGSLDNRDSPPLRQLLDLQVTELRAG